MKLVGCSNNMERKEIFLFKILNVLYDAVFDFRRFNTVSYFSSAFSGINI